MSKIYVDNTEITVVQIEEKDYIAIQQLIEENLKRLLMFKNQELYTFIFLKKSLSGLHETLKL